MIDREKVIKCLKAYVDCYCNRHSKCEPDCMLYGYGDCAKYAVEYISNAIDILKEQETELQKKQSEQKHGHWVLDPDGMDWNIPAWCCSECHCRNDNIPPNIEKVNLLRWSGSKFCPNCGAKMER